jgi:hypothetical protein
MLNDKYYIGNIPPEEYLVEVQRGRVGGASIVYKFGSNFDVDTTTVPEDIWANGGLYQFPTDVATLGVASTSANDDGDPAGTGAHKILISGLDANYNEVDVEVILNGTTTVNTTQTFRRVNRAYILEAGSSEYNEGIISIRHNGTGTYTVATIPAIDGQTQQTIYTVPAGKTAYIEQFSGSVVRKNSGVATLDLWLRDPINLTRRLQNSITASISGTSTVLKKFPYIPISEKTDIYIRCPYVSVIDLAVFANYSLLLLDN